MNKIIQGDCLETMRTLPDNSVDAIVTDPPAGISFMGKSWDDDKGGRDHWIKWMQEIATECNRVLKPGGHALVWAIPRTSHWTATAWENAGFQVRDIIAHVFGSGFPKSLNVGKAVDKLQGNERVGTGEIKHHAQKGVAIAEERGAIGGGAFGQAKDEEITVGTSEWEGWGTALKPAREDWLLLRKPLEKGMTVVENVLKWGTGGIAIDACRVGYVNDYDEKHQADIARGQDNATNGKFFGGNGKSKASSPTPTGRFPANLIHDGSDEVVELFPNSKSGNGKANTYDKEGGQWGKGKQIRNADFGDSGSASRFFYCAKSSKSERNRGCEGLFILKEKVPQEDIGEIKQLLSL